jgi:hypothetical protein
MPSSSVCLVKTRRRFVAALSRHPPDYRTFSQQRTALSYTSHDSSDDQYPSYKCKQTYLSPPGGGRPGGPPRRTRWRRTIHLPLSSHVTLLHLHRHFACQNPRSCLGAYVPRLISQCAVMSKPLQRSRPSIPSSGLGMAQVVLLHFPPSAANPVVYSVLHT